MVDNTKIDYVCPVCFEKTIYKKSIGKEWWEMRNLLDEIIDCRRELEKIKGINIRLDESDFCKHCKPDVEKSKLCLQVNIGGESDTTRVCNISITDVQLIREFLNDELVHKTFNDGETPLVNDIVRIKLLLGFE